MMYLTEIEQAIMKFIGKNKKPRIAKVILSRKSEAGVIAIPDLQLYYKAIVTKMAWYWYLHKQVEQWCRIEDMDINPKKYNFLILDKGAKICNGEKIASSTNGAGKTGKQYATE